MVDRRIGIAVLAIISLGAAALAQRFGLLRAGSRVWRVCLVWGVFGAVLALSAFLMQRGSTNVFTFATLILVAVGALGGVLAAVLMVFIEQRWPSEE
jgi:hypothetical protein